MTEVPSKLVVKFLTLLLDGSVVIGLVVIGVDVGVVVGIVVG